MLAAAVNNVKIFGLNLEINPIAFEINIGNFYLPVHWYGIIIAAGFILALLYGYGNAKRLGVDSDRMMDVIIISTVGALFGARLYYTIFPGKDGQQITSIPEFFGFSEDGFVGFAGLAIYGGIIGAVVTGIIVAKIRKVSILDLLDLASIGFLIGQGIGRWGNFFNQEAFGSATGSDWWGMTSEPIRRVLGDKLAHPCFLYESVWCLIGVLVLHLISKKRRFSGQVALCYCVWYGFGRAIIETMRTDSLRIIPIEVDNFLDNLNRVSFLVSVVICVAALTTLIVLYVKNKKAVLDTKYGTMFDAQMESTIIKVSDENSEEEIEETIEAETEKEKTESEDI